MKVIFERPKSLNDKEFTYCPGCHHGIIHRLIAEVIDELNIQDRTIMVAPVGCSVFAYEFFEVDGTVAPHGRALAVATGIKRALPDRMVFTYQGDGDLASIGIAETIHAANRGEKLTTIFVNNAVYGMTGGQMAPTTLLGQKTTTSPRGRNAENEGFPLHVSELLSTIPGVAYLERTTVSSPRDILNTKKAIRKAFLAQLKGLGFGLVEVLSTCPTNWKMTPVEAQEWLLSNMVKEFPPKIFVDRVGD
ncbi:thiamine pyrophosphate-dependent enzyme [Thermotoga neapolitana]|uniref:Thiamine pyrophosphate enzyme domain protein TPP-binding n=1 Tax=Thermotoga neapolitana (strain ATCC 49049 / DSM 4359 / NBRC 107923 / NS-E) TaxID=309803 RepID=B9K842_THENN|nr:thiamine pyrophosphate-dependent enzyme [Thermotoga neapolitana]ACM23125.1 Thiamine pyrophosphate enzyme domain protein TPP-binding [Thermotoga neapolitana DSM 4359]KFZ21933.1 Thiamine pyrophosphate enzyme domain protein TPP-binding [Thermotoga neapolitana LA10]HBF11595.1 2-oxoglutarate oxidoreductase [Thermotoga neapolitana]